MTSPTEALRRYLDANATQDFTSAWHLLCAADQDTRPLDAYLQVKEAAPRGNVPDRTFGQEEIEGDQATVVVTSTSADVAPLAEQVKAGTITMKEYGRRLRAGEFGSSPKDRTYRLCQEESGWRVIVGFRSRGKAGAPK